MAMAFPELSVTLLTTVSEHLEVFWAIVNVTGYPTTGVVVVVLVPVATDVATLFKNVVLLHSTLSRYRTKKEIWHIQKLIDPNNDENKHKHYNLR
jgi:hypothetical protein